MKKVLFNSLFLIGIILLTTPVLAEEPSTSTPEILEETPSSTPQIPDSPTTTPAIPEEVTSTPTLSSSNQVDVLYLDETIFSGQVDTTSTWFYDATGSLYSNTSTITALGVLMQAAREGEFSVTVQDFGWGYYVSDINDYIPAGFDGWVYNINQQDPGWVGINDYPIQDTDSLQVYYSVWPWKIESDVTSTYVGESVNFTAYKYTSSTWLASPSTTISIQDELFIGNDLGQYAYTTTTTGTISAYIYGSADWPQNSPAIAIEILDLPFTPTTTPTSTDDNTGNDNGGGDSGGSDGTPENNLEPTPQSEIQAAVDKILAYLQSQQDDTGKIIDGGISDWALMSFGAAGQYAQDIKKTETSLLDYALAYDFSSASDLNLCATYPRHTLALLAGGVDSSNTTIQELITKIKSNECYTNNLYGENGINDDIFGLLALLITGEATTTTIVQDILQTIIDDQQADGAFTWAGYPGADITGGALNALRYGESKGLSIEQDIYTKAKKYLRNTQLPDGGWGYGSTDVLTTSWVLMGINALDENQTDWWTEDDKNPWQPLVGLLNNEGYYESAWVPGTTDWFGEKHAIPALLGNSWPIVLEPNKGETNGTTQTGTPSYSATDTQTTTTTPTSTLDIIIPSSPTSTPTSTLETEIEENTTSTTPILQEPAESATSPIQDIAGEQIVQTPITQTKPQVPSSKIDKIKITSLTTSSTEESILTNTTTSPKVEVNDLATSPTKNIFLFSLASTGLLGLFLAWKFIKMLL